MAKVNIEEVYVMSAYSAKEVANWILAEASAQRITVSPMQLQKILYYLQGYSLGMTSIKLFEDDIEAWTHGPVVPSVYSAYKKYGGKSILPPPNVVIPEEFQNLVSSVVKEKGTMSAFSLSDATHSDPPYQETARNQVITVDKIETYFSSLFWASDEEDEYQPYFESVDEEKRYFLENISQRERHAILTGCR
ncbi:hypothetical protein FACS1894167_09150 [Synergistales bacterium]|nr:hypothetical protein FACS1894167_09150 [Synergistales bacterium]